MRAYNFLHIPPNSPALPDSSILLLSTSSFKLSFLHCFSGGCHGQGTGLVLDHTEARRPHRRPRAGGDLVKGAVPVAGPDSRALAGTLPISKEPLRGASGWGNRLLVVTDNEEGIAYCGDRAGYSVFQPEPRNCCEALTLLDRQITYASNPIIPPTQHISYKPLDVSIFEPLQRADFAITELGGGRWREVMLSARVTFIGENISTTRPLG